VQLDLQPLQRKDDIDGFFALGAFMQTFLMSKVHFFSQCLRHELLAIPCSPKYQLSVAGLIQSATVLRQPQRSVTMLNVPVRS